MPLSISDLSPRVQYTATAGQTIFDAPWVFLDEADLVVLQNDVVLALGGDYTVTGEGLQSGGTVTLITGAALNDDIVIYRDMPFERLSDFANSGDFLSDDLNAEFIRLVLMIQQLDLDLTRAIKLPVEESANDLPAAASRANKVLQFDLSGQPQAVSTITFDGVNVIQVTNIAALTALAVGTLTDGQQISALGYYAAGDGGGGPPRYWSAASTATPNGGSVLQPDSLPAAGRWLWSGGANVNAADFGAKGDASADATAAVNAAILYLVLSASGGGKIVFTPGKEYLILGPVLVPSNIHIDLNGATLVGAGATVGTMFRSAYVSGGAVISNIGTPNESQSVSKSSVYGGRVENCGQIFDFFDFNDGCSVHDLAGFDARQFGKFDRCFYCKFDRLTCRGSSVSGTPTYHFKGANNAQVLTSVTAVTAWPYHFEGCAAVTMNACSAEGGVKGIKLTGDCLSFNVNGCYFEAIQGTLFDVADGGTVVANFNGNYINLVDVVFDDGGSLTAGPAIFGNFDETNFIGNIGVLNGGFTYRGLMRVSAQGNHMKYTLRADNGGLQTIPTNWTISANTDISVTSTATAVSASDYRQKSLFSGIGILPIRRAGDTGPAYTGLVLFTTVTPSVGSVVIDTEMTWRPDSLFAKFTFTVQDGAGFAQVYGDLYGANVDRRSAGAITVAASDNGGFVRLTLAITGTLVAITGSVQIVS